LVQAAYRVIPRNGDARVNLSVAFKIDKKLLEPQLATKPPALPISSEHGHGVFSGLVRLSDISFPSSNLKCQCGCIPGAKNRLESRILRQRALQLDAADPTRLAEGRTGGFER